MANMTASADGAGKPTVNRFPAPTFAPPKFAPPKFAPPTFTPPPPVELKPRGRVAAPALSARRTLSVPPPIQRANNIPSAASYDAGVPNPYGTGVSAYEPNTEIYTPTYDRHQSDNPLLRGYADAFNAVQDSKVKDSETVAATATTTYAPSGGNVIGSGGTGAATLSWNPKAGTGSVKAIIDAAQTMLGKPYVWGGTTSRGVDCSGLIYYAFRQAGINIPRYRAVDYGHLGTAVTADKARAGDLVYWDHPGTDTDHVGIYLGNGMVIQSPQSGDVTKISKVWGNAQFRRVLNDAAFGTQATPTGAAVTSYAGKPASQVFSTARVSVAAPVKRTV